LQNRIACLVLCILWTCEVEAQTLPIEVGVDLTGTHLHKIDDAPVGIGARVIVDLQNGAAIDLEATKYSGKASFLAGPRAGVRFSRFGAYVKARVGVWHVQANHFAADLGGVLEYYRSRHVTIRMDFGDTVIFYGGERLGTVHNFQPGIGIGYRF